MDLPKEKASHKMTYQEMVDGCKSSNREAWEIFFQNYTPRIYRYITKVLQGWLLYREAQDREVICNIFDRVVDKLLLNASKMDDPVKLLYVLARNAVSEWRREQKRVKNIVRQRAEDTMESLDAPIVEDENLTVADVFCSKEFKNSAHEEVNGITEEEMIEAIRGLRQPYRLIMEVVTIYDVPLSEDAINNIAKNRGVTVEEVKEEARNLLGKLHERYLARINHEQRLINRHAKLSAIKREIARVEKNPVINREELVRLKSLERTEEAALAREQARKKRYIRPTSEEIARFVGMHRDNPKRINVLICRARNELKRLLPR